jgi:hypothetical protein
MKTVKTCTLKEKNFDSGQLSSSKAKVQLITHNGKFYDNNPENKALNDIAHRLLILW